VICFEPRKIADVMKLGPIRNYGTQKTAVSLVELLVVLGILAILALLVLPVAGKARESALQARCLSNMRQFFIALLTYQADHDGWFPPGEKAYFSSQAAEQAGGPKFSDSLGGMLRNEGYIPRDADFYCPSMRLDAFGRQNYPDEKKRLRQLIGYSFNGYLSQARANNLSALWPANIPYPGDSRMIAVGETSGAGGHMWVKQHLDRALFGYPGPRIRSTLPRNHRYPDGLNFIFLDGHAEILRRGSLDKDVEGWTEVMDRWGRDGRHVAPGFHNDIPRN